MIYILFTKKYLKMISNVFIMRKLIKHFKILLIFLISLLTFIIFYCEFRNHNVNVVYIQDLNSNEKKLYISMIPNQIRTFNEIEIIRNLESYGELKEETIIFVMLLDKFSSDFNTLLQSLSQIYGIDEALLLFSHSYFDENLNNMIRNIDFCRVLQIYYPYSIQTHQNEFPGYSESDCKNNRKFTGNCTGSTRDMRGRFREPTRSEKKHHWWWTANTVFSNLTSTQNHKGLVIFMEGNFIFSEDFIYMASFMKTIADSPPRVEFLSFGGGEIPSKIDVANFYRLRQHVWSPNVTDMIAFDVRTWDSIVAHYDVFCTFDDASWRRSLYFVSVKRKDGDRYKTLSNIVPRVFKLGRHTPGMLSLFGFGDKYDELRFKSLVNASVGNLFPVYLELYTDVVSDDDDDVIFDYSEGDGGWADQRDWELCRKITSDKTQRVVLQMKQEFIEYFVGS